MTEILSNGGGTQSAAMIALVVTGQLPKPDFVCIVDTGRECATTWQYLDAVTGPALKRVGIEVHRIKTTEWGTQPDHGKNWLSHNGNTVLLPAFTSSSGVVGKLSGFCSKTWKVETQNRYVREALGVPTREQRNWIGFSLDESRRAVRMMCGEEYKADRIRFPLIERHPMRRHQSIRLVEKMGWPTPPRSRCWNCPNQTDDEWRGLTPEEFEAACKLEDEVRAVDPHIWFHKSGVPLRDVVFEPAHADLFGDRVSCDSGGCFT